MNIGMVSKFGPEQDGIAIYTDNLILNLRKQGISVVKIGTPKSDCKYPVDFNSLSLKKILADIIEKEHLDLLHIQYIAPYYGKHILNLNIIRALDQKVPVVVTLHEVHTTQSNFKEKVLSWIEKAMVKRASLSVVHTHKQKEFLQQKVPSAAVETIFMGITPLQMHHQKYKNLLFFGLLSRNKGVHLLLRAMAKLSDYSLIVAGKLGDNIDQSYAEELKQIKKELQLDNVTLEIGWVSEARKKELFLHSDILVMPYLWAPYQSAVLHDSFSYGLPVVVTDAGSVHEVVDEFKAGIVVRANSETTLIEGIQKANKQYKQLQAGILDYRKEANWEAVALKLAKEYKKLAKK